MAGNDHIRSRFCSSFASGVTRKLVCRTETEVVLIDISATGEIVRSDASFRRIMGMKNIEMPDSIDLVPYFFVSPKRFSDLDNFPFTSTIYLSVSVRQFCTFSFLSKPPRRWFLSWEFCLLCFISTIIEATDAGWRLSPSSMPPSHSSQSTCRCLVRSVNSYWKPWTLRLTLEPQLYNANDSVFRFSLAPPRAPTSDASVAGLDANLQSVTSSGLQKLT